jgi:hypothetical protein
MMTSDAPRTAERLLEMLGTESEFRDLVLGDLAEEFGMRVQWDGQAAARRWYYREGLRVAPYLLRDWWRGSQKKHARYLARVVLASSAALMALEWLLQRVKGLLLPTESARAMAAGLPLLMLAWTLVSGLFAGYVAARIGRRAPIHSALLMAVAWAALMLRSGWPSVPPWFLALNVTTMVAATIAGGLFRVAHTIRWR